MTVIGKLDNDGNIETQADECAISGRPVLGEHSVAVRIKGTLHFYRYLTDFEHQFTPEKRAEIEAQVSKSASPRGGKAEKLET